MFHGQSLIGRQTVFRVRMAWVTQGEPTICQSTIVEIDASRQVLLDRVSGSSHSYIVS
jgi:hypothetical protein